MKHFADGGEIRIDAPQSHMPLLPEGSRHVGEGIDAKPVEPRQLNPPDGILQKVFCNDRILAVQVRQNSEKPAVGEVSPHRRRCVEIGKRFKGIVGNAGGT